MKIVDRGGIFKDVYFLMSPTRYHHRDRSFTLRHPKGIVPDYMDAMNETSGDNKMSRVWNILMVDDDEDDFIITKKILSEDTVEPFQITWAFSYSNGLDILKNHNFDAALIDYDLGNKTGIDLIRAIHLIGCEIPMIIYSGRIQYHGLPGTQPGEYAAFLSKANVTGPLLEQTLLSAIHQHSG
jgi:CheY-like chemotaxis protein